MPKITVELSEASLQAAVDELNKYARWVERKTDELRFRLATIGATAASIRFSRAIYNGTNDVSVRVDDTGSVAVIYAEGKSVAFIEFGSGKKYGYGHPLAGQLGVGPGTYSDDESLGGRHHWDNPKGWYYGSGQHSYGNPPAQAMIAARDAIAENVARVAREVFSHG